MSLITRFLFFSLEQQQVNEEITTRAPAELVCFFCKAPCATEYEWQCSVCNDVVDPGTRAHHKCVEERHRQDGCPACKGVAPGDTTSSEESS